MMKSFFALKRMCQPPTIIDTMEKPAAVPVLRTCSSSTATADDPVVSPLHEEDDPITTTQHTRNNTRLVTFGTVSIREYPITLARGVRHGPAIELAGWDCYREREPQSVDDHKSQHETSTGIQHLYQPIAVRIWRLQKLHYSRKEIAAAFTEASHHNHSLTVGPAEWVRREVRAVRRAARLRRALYRLQHEGWYEQQQQEQQQQDTAEPGESRLYAPRGIRARRRATKR